MWMVQVYYFCTDKCTSGNDTSVLASVLILYWWKGILYRGKIKARTSYGSVTDWHRWKGREATGGTAMCGDKTIRHG